MSRGSGGGTTRAGSGRGKSIPPFWRLGPSLSRPSTRSEWMPLPPEKRWLSPRELLDDDAGRRAAGGGFARDFFPDLGGDVAEGLRVGRIRLRHGDRAPLVGSFSDREIERHLAQEIDAEPLRLAAGTAMREDIAALAAMRAQEVAHILDYPEHRHIDFGEHVEALAVVDQRDVLPCRDDDRGGQRRLPRP